ncbi:MAG TPA: DUF397 domain-containing protein [Streptosporangiaceae bacterium]
MPDLAVPKLTAARPASAKLTGVCWQKSRHSNSQGACVELAGLPDGDIAIRNSRDPDGVVLFYTKAEIRALIEGVKEGDFDNLLR